MQMTAAFDICLQMRALIAVGGWPQAPCQKAGAAVASMPPSPENDAAAKNQNDPAHAVPADALPDPACCFGRFFGRGLAE
jgi:hypothetical protein